MPLSILAPLVIIGIVAGVLFVHLTGGSSKLQLGDEADAMQRFLLDFPEAEIRRIILTNQRDAAVLQLVTASKPAVFGLVWCMGARHLTRFVFADELVDLSRNGDNQIIMKLRDFTLAAVELQFDSAKTTDTVMAWMKPETPSPGIMY